MCIAIFFLMIATAIVAYRATRSMVSESGASTASRPAAPASGASPRNRLAPADTGLPPSRTAVKDLSDALSTLARAHTASSGRPAQVPVPSQLSFLQDLAVNGDAAERRAANELRAQVIGKIDWLLWPCWARTGDKSKVVLSLTINVSRMQKDFALSDARLLEVAEGALTPAESQCIESRLARRMRVNGGAILRLIPGDFQSDESFRWAFSRPGSGS